ncbi:MAG: S-layer homology domain-containing protein [Oscillospiraceae bacterium]|nr:S-layer homology domain-containing protein [Oscillospiraceae bacterium]
MKKILSLVLSIVLIFGVMAPAALAADWTDGPTFTISASEIDAEGGMIVTVGMHGDDDDYLGAVTLTLVYDSDLVEPDTTKGSFKKSGKFFGLDFPECINSFTSKLATPAATKTVDGSSCTVYMIAATTDDDPSEGVGENSEIHYYFKAKEGASGVARFVLATDNAGNFKVTDISGDYNVPLPAHGSLTATVAIPVSAVTLSGTVTTPAKNLADATALSADTSSAVVSHSWSPALSGGKFAAETVYTLTITVKPADGAAFAEACTVTYGDYSFTKQADGSYTASKTFPATLGKDAATVTVGDIADQTYTGAQITPSVAISTDPALVEGTDYTVSYGENVNAGTGSVTVSPVTSSEYAFEAVTKEFNILPVTVGLTWPETTALPYSGSEQSIEATVSGLLGSDTATLSYTGNKGTDAGSYTATVTAIDNANYALPEDGSTTQAWSITKAAYTGDALSASAIVPAKGIADKTFNLSELGLPKTFKNAKIKAATPDGTLATAATVAGDGKSLSYTTAEAADNATGSITLTISSKNWKDVTATLNLTARTLDTDPGFDGIGASDVEYGKTNGEAVGALPIRVTLTDPEGAEIAAALSVKDAETVNNVGTASVTVVLTVTQEGVYNGITAEKDFTYTVTPKETAVTWTDTALSYTGAAQAPSASAEGVNGETLSLTVSGAQTDAGEGYTATAAIDAVTGGNALASNYTLTGDSTAFSIAPKAVAFTVELDKTELTETGSEVKPTVTVKDGETALSEGTDYTLAFAPAESILPGSYMVTATGAGNYAGSSGTASYTIQGKPAYKSLSLVDGRVALTANYAFDANFSDITGYSVAVAEVDGETVTPIAGSPFDAGTATSYTVSGLTTGSTYRVTVTATNAVGSTASESKDITLRKAPAVAMYRVTVEDAENGAVRSNRSLAAAGAEVSLTVTPDEGYELAALTVTSAEGEEIAVEGADGAYTFEMPAAAVTASASFKLSGEPVHFDDVPEDAWYHDAVYWAAGEGVAQGKAENTFAPEDISSRGELITFLWRAAGKPATTLTENPYGDVSERDACYEAVLWATEQGITVGTGEGEFNPNAAVTRAQMVEFIYRAEKAEPVDVENPFTDVDAADYFYDSVMWAVETGVTVGTSATTFDPNMACTRAHAVTFLYRLYA